MTGIKKAGDRRKKELAQRLKERARIIAELVDSIPAEYRSAIMNPPSSVIEEIMGVYDSLRSRKFKMELHARAAFPEKDPSLWSHLEIVLTQSDTKVVAVFALNTSKDYFRRWRNVDAQEHLSLRNAVFRAIDEYEDTQEETMRQRQLQAFEILVRTTTDALPKGLQLSPRVGNRDHDRFSIRITKGRTEGIKDDPVISVLLGETDNESGRSLMPNVSPQRNEPITIRVTIPEWINPYANRVRTIVVKPDSGDDIYRSARETVLRLLPLAKRMNILDPMEKLRRELGSSIDKAFEESTPRKIRKASKR